MSQSQPKSNKRRKKKVSKAQTLAARRRADKARREQQRAKQKRKREIQRAYKFRVKVVRLYRGFKKQIPEKEAIKVVLAKYNPKEDWHYKLSARSMIMLRCVRNQPAPRQSIIRCRRWSLELFSSCVTNWVGVDTALRLS